ncbi:hypothetical protein GQ457_12G016950 [Hibiscus cannabinus]
MLRPKLYFPVTVLPISCAVGLLVQVSSSDLAETISRACKYINLAVTKKQKSCDFCSGTNSYRVVVLGVLEGFDLAH